MNRLYWVDTVTLQWQLVLESPDENLIMREAATRLHTAMHGVVGYSKICIKAIPTDYIYWTEYNRYEAGGKRATKITAELPKPIRLLEMLNEPHASA